MDNTDRGREAALDKLVASGVLRSSVVQPGKPVRFEIAIPWEGALNWQTYSGVQVDAFLLGVDAARHPDSPFVDQLVAAARDLRTEDGSNPEYDRALIELVKDMTGLEREDLEQRVLGDRA